MTREDHIIAVNVIIRAGLNGAFVNSTSPARHAMVAADTRDFEIMRGHTKAGGVTPSHPRVR